MKSAIELLQTEEHPLQEKYIAVVALVQGILMDKSLAQSHNY